MRIFAISLTAVAINFTLTLGTGLFVPAYAQDMTTEGGLYVGYGQVQRTVETIFGDVDGDGSSIILGYRRDAFLSFELEVQDIDYDDITVQDVRVFDTTGDFTYFSIIFSGEYGQWQPYGKLIFGDSDVSGKAMQGDTVSTSKVTDSGQAFGLGFDFAFTDNFVLRADYTIQSDHQDVITIAPIWRF